jgi:hypothetical protein
MYFLRRRRHEDRLALAVLSIAVPVAVSAADLPVSYLVEDKPLKEAITGTSLTFTFSDTTCATPVYSVFVNAENVSVLSKLKQATPKGDTKHPNAAGHRLHAQALLDGLAALPASCWSSHLTRASAATDAAP